MKGGRCSGAGRPSFAHGALQLPRPPAPPADPGSPRDHGDHLLPPASDPGRPGTADPRPALHAASRSRAPALARPRPAALDPVRPLHEAPVPGQPRRLDQLSAADDDGDLPAAAGDALPRRLRGGDGRGDRDPGGHLLRAPQGRDFRSGRSGVVSDRVRDARVLARDHHDPHLRRPSAPLPGQRLRHRLRTCCATRSSRSSSSSASTSRS